MPTNEKPFYLYRFVGDDRFVDFNRNEHHRGPNPPDGYEFVRVSNFRNAPEAPVEIYVLKEQSK